MMWKWQTLQQKDAMNKIKNNGAASVEKCRVPPTPKIKNRTSYNPAIPSLGIYLSKTKLSSPGDVCTPSYGSNIHNSQGMEIT